MITAIILAAGQSTRMGQPKMLLPWGETTVLERVIETFKAAAVDDVLVVTGGDREHVEAVVGTSARMVFNPDFAKEEMLSSIQAGLAGLTPEIKAILIGLGDQPLVRERNVQLVMEAYYESDANIVVPSFKMRRGHPWLVTKSHWNEIRHMRSPASMRDFLNYHTNEIHYVNVVDDSILQDLDTPEDYLKTKP